MKGCNCNVPRPGTPTENRPHQDTVCRVCGKWISPGVVSSDENFQGFFSWLLELPGIDQNFVPYCREREKQGREQYGLAYLAKDGPREAMEEAADLAIYCYLHLLKAKRDGTPQETEKALQAATHAAKAWSVLKGMV